MTVAGRDIVIILACVAAAIAGVSLIFEPSALDRKSVV